MAFYAIDPWGDQRADLRMAQTVWASLAPHSRSSIDANDFRLFPDEANGLPEDVSDQEKAWMLKLDRTTE